MAMSQCACARPRYVPIVALIVAMMWCAVARAQTTIMVPSNQPTIQAGINAANSGDIVLVAPGTYVENINFSGKAITVTSSSGPLVTIIDGAANGTVITFNHKETASTVLSGFTIRNGLQNGLSGGGILITAASPTISNNIITGNHAAVGIGMYINGGSPVVKNNTITANDQKGAGDGGSGGGGILVAGNSTTPGSPEILSNTITNNSVAGGGNGGGISVTYFSSPLIQGNLIRGNTAYNYGGGISVQSYNSPVVVDNVIADNTAMGGGSGGGIYVSPSNLPITFVNNTIAANRAVDGTSGIFTTGFAQHATFVNNIVVAYPAQNAITCDTSYSSISPVFSYNDSYSATGAAWSGPCDSTSNPGNISADPLFLSAPNNDFHLSLGSPAIDAGNNAAPDLPSKDYDNNPRIADGDGDGDSIVDLGGYEVVGTGSANLNPSQLSFNPQMVGAASAARAVTLSSTGSAPFQITSIQITGDFTQNSTCPVLGAPGDSTGVAAGNPCMINIVFTPTTEGPRSGLLTVNGTNGTSLKVPLNGTGTNGSVGSLSPTNLVFPGQPIGTQSVPQTVTLANTGVGTLNIASITANGPFAQTNNCGTALQPGSSCSINVVFSPSVTGPASNVLFIQDNFDGISYSVNLNGSGVDYTITPSVNSETIVRGSSKTITISLAPLGGTFGSPVALSCSGLPSESTCSFSPSSPVPGSAGASSSMTIYTDRPETRVGTYTVTVTGTSGTLSRTTQVVLTITKKKR
jgi:hypothetical protein